MTIIHALILGIVEGFTEFLPISSTAHLTLTSYLLGLDQSAFVKTFEIAIQSGAIVAVLAIYWRKFLDRKILEKIILAFVPTAVIGLALYKVAKVYLMGNLSVILWSLLLGGIIIMYFEKYWAKKSQNVNTEPVDIDAGVNPSSKISAEIRSMNLKNTILIGVFQSIAIIPGVSRSAATIIGGRILGMTKEAIVEFSFLLAVPTILAATGLDLLKNYKLFTMSEFNVLSTGFVMSFLTALFAINFLMRYIRKHSFVSFGIYRIIIAIIFAVFIFRY